jgi:hypothetical protein
VSPAKKWGNGVFCQARKMTPGLLRRRSIEKEKGERGKEKVSGTFFSAKNWRKKFLTRMALSWGPELT